MKSSNKSKMGDFERKWSEAFEGAEATPSDKLWTSIHAKLANAEAATYKKRIVYYRWAAAVALLLLVGVSTYTFVQTNQKEIADQTIIDQEPNQESSTVEGQDANSQYDRSQSTQDGQIADQESSVDDQKVNAIGSDHQADIEDKNIDSDRSIDNKIVAEVSDNTGITVDDHLANTGQREISTEPNAETAGAKVIEDVQSNQENLAQGHTGLKPPNDGQPTDPTVNTAAILENEEKSLASNESVSTLEEALASAEAFTKQEQDLAESVATVASAAESTWIALAGMGVEADAVEVQPQIEHIYLVPVVNVNHPIQKQEATKLWAGLSFGPGSFDPNYQQQAAETQLVAAAAPNAQSSFIVKEDSNPGLSVAMGMDVGMNLTSRWRITSGLQYFNSSVDANTNAVAEASNTPVYNSFSSYDISADGRGINSGRYIFAPDTDLQSTFEFLSVPLEAGYLVLDKKVQVVLNAGVGTNIFIKNNIQDKQNNLADVTITPGAAAPFKTVYFNGLMGAEVLYGIGDQFNISLKPQYRTALNDFTKSNSEFSSRPSAFGVSLGVQYNIK